MNSQTTATTFKMENDTMDCVGAESEDGTTSNLILHLLRIGLHFPTPTPLSLQALLHLTAQRRSNVRTAALVIIMKSAHHWP